MKYAALLTNNADDIDALGEDEPGGGRGRAGGGGAEVGGALRRARPDRRARLRRRARQPDDREDRARPRRRDDRHRRALRRDEGADRRAHGARGRGPRRGDRDRGPDPGRLPRLRRAEARRSSIDGGRARSSGRNGAVPSPVLTRVLGDLDRAEDAVQDAFTTALERWPRDGTPREPRRLGHHDRAQPGDRPAPPRADVRPQGRAARTARVAAGRGGRRELDPGRPARARLHLLPPRARRGVAGRADAARGRRPDDDARSRTRSSSPSRRWRSGWCARSGRSATPASPSACRPTTCSPSGSRSVLAVLYLVFNEGYSATRRRASAVRASLCDEAIRLGEAARRADAGRARGARPARADAAARRPPRGAHRARRLDRPARRIRTARAGARTRIAEGTRVLERALSHRRPGSYQLQAAIAALHVEEGETDWPQIAALYDELARLEPTPIVELNRAVAVAMAHGPEFGLELVERIDLPGLPPAARRARRLPAPARSAPDEAAAAYRAALALEMNAADRAFLERRLAEVRSVRDMYRAAPAAARRRPLHHRRRPRDDADLPPRPRAARLRRLPLLKDDEGTEQLRRYYAPYASLARERGVGLILESPTWRANPDWAAEIGYSLDELDALQPQGDRADGGDPRGVRVRRTRS